jgi:hypothetical protein
MDHESLLMRLRRLRTSAGSAIRNTPHSCQTDEHCCALHAAHGAAAEKVEALVQALIDELESAAPAPTNEEVTCPKCGATCVTSGGPGRCHTCSHPLKLGLVQDRG